MQKQFQTFEDLAAYNAARSFRRAMYDVARTLPSIEKFGLAGQIRRAAVSLTNNIAEGHGRYHFLDQIRFMLQARGSLQELMDDLNVCEGERYIDPKEVVRLKDEGWNVLKVLNGYLRHLRDKKTAGGLVLKESAPSYGASDDDLESWLESLMLEPSKSHLTDLTHSTHLTS